MLKNIDKIRAYGRKYSNERRLKDLNFRIRTNLRGRTAQAIAKNYKSISSVKLVGCTIEYLRKHLEALFVDGMSWDNYGRKNGNKGWEIDHIIPCCSFDLSKEDEQKKCFHYTNLQPLWAEDNLSKGGCY